MGVLVVVGSIAGVLVALGSEEDTDEDEELESFEAYLSCGFDIGFSIHGHTVINLTSVSLSQFAGFM
jgi:hypothetical protein